MGCVRCRMLRLVVGFREQRGVCIQVMSLRRVSGGVFGNKHMRRMGIALVALLMVNGCGKQAEPGPCVERPALPPTFEHAWVMRESWYMACAVAVVSNKCWYWFASDVVDPAAPQYPVILDCAYDAGGLRLKTGARVYSTNFLAVVTDGATNLLAECDGSRTERLFRVHRRFDGADPFGYKSPQEPGSRDCESPAHSP